MPDNALIALSVRASDLDEQPALQSTYQGIVFLRAVAHQDFEVATVWNSFALHCILSGGL
jgi:hypothetical protein